jgi:hypothetical protein
MLLSVYMVHIAVCCIFVGGGGASVCVCMHYGERELDYMLRILGFKMYVHAERARVWRAFDMLYLWGRYIYL